MRIGGVPVILEEQELKEDRLAMAHSFIISQKEKENGYSVSQCLRMFGVSSSGYYAYVGRMEDRNGKRAEKEKEEADLMEKMRQVVLRRQGIIPGKRTFREYLFRMYGMTVNVKHIARLMKKMNLVSQRPHKDAYKHRAGHDHVCAAPANLLDRRFFIGPRKVILTDITYLYHGSCRDTFYLCVFRDPFTRENLGWSVSERMDVSVVKEAYEMMMGSHGKELRNCSVYLHSDQGSVYLSTSFRQLLADDGFLQSVSDRGNSQDNAPMESFFSKLKTDILDLTARCVTFDTAKKLVEGYLRAYNEEHYQYELAGLTPSEFYDYAVTGIYPLESYFGIPASEMNGPAKVKEIRTSFAEKEAKKERSRNREEKRRIDPLAIIDRDCTKLRRLINKWQTTSDSALLQVAHLRSVLMEAEKAAAFIRGKGEETVDELKDPLRWRLYPELSYVYRMNELF